MGRVLNALVRADRWTDGECPIGSSASTGTTEIRKVGATTALPLDDDLASVVPSVFESDQSVALAFAELQRVVTATTKPRLATEFTGSPTREEIAKPRLPKATEPVQTQFHEPKLICNVGELDIDSRLVAINNEDPAALERYQRLAVKLLNLVDRKKLKTLLITSAEAAEGKTTVAINLAWLLAKHRERRVLLVAAGSSSVLGALGLNAERGRLNPAQSPHSFEDIAVRLDPNRLYVYAPAPANSNDRGLSLELERVIARMSSAFDLIIVDSPAIIESAEAQRLASVLDAAVIVARAGRTHQRQVNAARKLVPKERRLGIVLNQSCGIEDDRSQRKSLLGRFFSRRR